LGFRFDADAHLYYYQGVIVPHITELLDRGGWIDDTWYTEESSERGVQVHRLTADYDLGAIDVASCRSAYRGYLLSHVKAFSIMRPKILAVEEPAVHPELRFGGRPDRELLAYDLHAVLEGKSGDPTRAHQIQTALQAILLAPRAHLPAEALARFALYWKGSGKFKLEEHRDVRRDFAEARRLIHKYCV
jgi:hypothetical protein